MAATGGLELSAGRTASPPHVLKGFGRDEMREGLGAYGAPALHVQQFAPHAHTPATAETVVCPGSVGTSALARRVA